jgi:hypothetical protein
MDPRVTELHCIMPIENIGSIMQHGILSYERAAALKHTSVAMQPVQDKRDRKEVPGGLTLHRYANLYWHARNPMLYKRLNESSRLCVLRVSLEVLGTRGTVITDCNAASDWVRFLHPDQWRMLPFDDIFAEDWRDLDTTAYYRKKSRKCAEVLVPHGVPSRFLSGGYVFDNKAEHSLREAGFGLPIAINPVLFFKQPSGA